MFQITYRTKRAGERAQALKQDSARFTRRASFLTMISYRIRTSL